MNIIIGKNGFIAKKLLSRNEYQFTTSDVNDSSAFYLDLKNSNEFDYTCLNEKTAIIFLAAVSSPDECNNNYKEAYKINVTGTVSFIRQAIKKGAKVLFFSSDVVYGNTTKSVDENSEINPFGNYAKMKDEVEKNF
jgi:dTDP-4-dehydrorhamnose reductase